MSDQAVEKPEDPEHAERLRVLTLVAQAMAHAANEVLLLGHLETAFAPQPASLTGTSEQRKELRTQSERVVRALGGPPPLLYVGQAGERPRYDTYSQAAIDEAVLMFERARSSVCRTHMHFIAGSMIERDPELLSGWPKDEEIAAIMRRLAVAEFWEHAETSYIKLASLWDRLGQLLDFAFFNIRQYERDGFPAVVDRIAANYVPISKELAEAPSWRLVREFQTSERPDGLKWLLRRRNLLIHSLHLRPRPEQAENDPLFDAAYNHLEHSVSHRLAVGTPQEELDRIHSHLTAAAALFHDVLKVCEIGADLRVSSRQ